MSIKMITRISSTTAPRLTQLLQQEPPPPHLNGGGVPDEEHAALPLPHEQVSGVLPGHRTEVPAGGRGVMNELDFKTWTEK